MRLELDCVRALMRWYRPSPSEASRVAFFTRRVLASVARADDDDESAAAAAQLLALTRQLRDERPTA